MSEHSADDVAAKKRVFARYADAVLRRRVAEIEMRAANWEYQAASTDFMTMLAEEKLGRQIDGSECVP